jgi:hypothetical protein
MYHECYLLLTNSGGCGSDELAEGLEAQQLQSSDLPADQVSERLASRLDLADLVLQLQYGVLPLHHVLQRGANRGLEGFHGGV